VRRKKPEDIVFDVALKSRLIFVLGSVLPQKDIDVSAGRIDKSSSSVDDQPNIKVEDSRYEVNEAEMAGHSPAIGQYSLCSRLIRSAFTCMRRVSHFFSYEILVVSVLVRRLALEKFRAPTRNIEKNFLVFIFLAPPTT
jgi:hypothetical protein